MYFVGKFQISYGAAHYNKLTKKKIFFQIFFYYITV